MNARAYQGPFARIECNVNNGQKRCQIFDNVNMDGGDVAKTFVLNEDSSIQLTDLSPDFIMSDDPNYGDFAVEWKGEETGYCDLHQGDVYCFSE